MNPGCRGDVRPHPIPGCNCSTRRETVRFGKLEFCKIESRRDRASHQRPVAGAFGSLPRFYGDNGLRHFARGEIGTEPDAALTAVVGNLQAQRLASVVMPDLHGVDAMPVRALA